jgi:hypothetical protein
LTDDESVPDAVARLTLPALRPYSGNYRTHNRPSFRVLLRQFRNERLIPQHAVIPPRSAYVSNRFKYMRADTES